MDKGDKVGFLFDESVAAPKVVRQKQVQLVPSVPGCDGCSLKQVWGTINTPRMRAFKEGTDPDILILGEAPGESEDAQGKQFVGQSGQLLRAEVSKCDYDRIAWQNAVRCRPPQNRTPLPTEVKSCSLYLNEDIFSIRPKAILGLGAVPLVEFFGWCEKQVQISEAHGLKFPVQIEDHVCWFYPTFHPAFIGRLQAAHPVFRANIKEFWNNIDRWPEPKIISLSPSQVIPVFDLETAQNLVARMTPPLGIDIETASITNRLLSIEGEAVLRPFEDGARILCAGVSDGNSTVAFPVKWPGAENNWGQQFLLELVQTKPWLAHNTAMELSWFWYNLGWGWTPNNYEDSMALARILHQRKYMISLEQATRIHLGVNVKSLTSVNAARILNYSLSEVLPYVGLDALACRLLYNKLKPQLSSNNKTHIERILGSIRSTVAMELKGLPVNLKTTRELLTEFEQKHDAVVAKITKLPEVKAFEAINHVKFSVTKPMQLGEILKLIPAAKSRLRFTKKGEESGRISTNEAVLDTLKDDVPIARLILEERELAKLISTYIKPLLSGQLIAPDGLMHPGYHVMLTHTGRTGSNSPNIQNWPKRANREIRRQVVAPPGHVLVAFDYKQLEAWQIACASRCSGLCSAIIRKDDIHTHWLNAIIGEYPDYLKVVLAKFHPSDEKLMKTARDNAKGSFVFASLFGATAETCAAQLGVPLDVVKRTHELFWKTYPGVKRYLETQHQLYNDTGSVSLLTGMVRHGIMKGNEPVNCVDFSTEALTTKGWKGAKTLQTGDTILTMNPKTELLEWQVATDVKVFPDYEGKTWHFQGKSIDVITTPNHRWAYYKDTHYPQKLWEGTSETLPNGGSIPRSRPYNGPKKPIIENDLVELIGWVLTDGGYPKGIKRKNKEGRRNTTQVLVYQKKEETSAQIDRLFNRLEIPFTKHCRDGQNTWMFSGGLGTWFRSVFPQRMLTPEFLPCLTAEQLNLLFDTMVAADGHKEAWRIGFVAGWHREPQIHAFQMLSILCGRPVNINYRDTSNRPEIPGFGKSPGCWVARETRRENVSLAYLKREVRFERIPMWCPMVPNTFFVARSKGKPFITGNTPVQGTSTGHLVLDAQNALCAKALQTGDHYFMPRINIHDDLTFVLPESESRLAEYIDIIGEELVALRYPWQIVPLTTEWSYGYNWCDLVEGGVITGKYYR